MNADIRMPRTVDRPGYVYKAVSVESLLEALMSLPADQWPKLMVMRDDADDGPIPFEFVHVNETTVVFK